MSSTDKKPDAAAAGADGVQPQLPAGPWSVVYDPNDNWYKYRVYGVSVLASAPIANVLGSEGSAAPATARLMAASWDYHAACTDERLDALRAVLTEYGSMEPGGGAYTRSEDRDHCALVRALLTDLLAARARVIGGDGGGGGEQP